MSLISGDGTHWNWSPRCLTVALHGLSLGRMEHCQSVTKPRWLSISFGRPLLELFSTISLVTAKEDHVSARVGLWREDQCCTDSPHQAGILLVLNSRTFRIRVGFFGVNEGKLWSSWFQVPGRIGVGVLMRTHRALPVSFFSISNSCPVNFLRYTDWIKVKV